MASPVLLRNVHSESVTTAAQVAELDRLRITARMFDELLDVLSFRDLELCVQYQQRGEGEIGECYRHFSESLRVSTLNGAIETDRLGSHAVGLRPVLDWLRSFSGEITEEVARLSGSLGELIREVDAVVFGLSAAKLQIEMTAAFAHELVNHAYMGGLHDGDRMTEGAISCLRIFV